MAMSATSGATTTPGDAVVVTMPDGTGHDAGDSSLDRALSCLTGREVVLEHVDARVAGAGETTTDEYEAEFPELDHIDLQGRVSFPTTTMTEARRDAWAGSTLQLGPDVGLDRVTRAARCIMTTVERADLDRDSRILQAIARENRLSTDIVGPLPCAGVFAEVARPGAVTLDAPLIIG